MCVVSLAPPLPARNFPFAVTLKGPSALAEPLGAALRAQWAFGFPIVPKPCLQLTHGFLHYPAGMQPVAAMHLLEVIPPGVVLDPFVGGGTTLIEALRSGRRPIGADASPLALFASAHHTWRASDAELDGLRAHASEAMRRCDPSSVLFRIPPEHTVVPSAPSDGGEAEPTDEHAEANRAVRSIPSRLDRGGAGKTTWKDWDP